MRAVSLLFHDVYVVDASESGFRSRAADRYKLSVRDMDAQLDGLGAARSDVPLVAADLQGAFSEMSRPLPFLITVDDGGASYRTLLADRLDARGWRGHCFVSTGMIGESGFLTRNEIRELDTRGHMIGSHSVSHPTRFSACSLDQMREEWTRSRATLEDLLGHEVRVASVPGGYYSRRVAETARDAGLRVLFTSEPTTALRDEGGILVVGRFAIRRGHPRDMARRLVRSSLWTRSLAWASWNAKGAVKPLLGASYVSVADWVHGGPGRRLPV